MSLLVDTHAFLWFLSGDGQLSGAAREAIEQDSGTPALSVGSVWELAIKTSIGKLELRASLERVVSEALDSGFALQPLTLLQLDRVSRMPFPDSGHKDPFDRLIAAQALDLGWALVSRDSSFDDYGVRRVW